MKWKLLFLFFAGSWLAHTQEYSGVIKKRLVVSDTIAFHEISVNPNFIRIKDKTGRPIDTTSYRVDYSNALIIVKNATAIATDSIDVQYLPLDNLLTRSYKLYDTSIILGENSRQEQLVALKKPTYKPTFIPFDGLQVSGSITRGIRVGNNQNSVVDSELDLRITGQLSEKVSLRASIQDANVPQTQNGYAQRLDEFDQIFIELFSDNWNIRAGDVDLQQTDYQFNNFTKRVQGIAGQIKFDGDESSGYAGAAGALVRGTFNTSRFTGQEGNQGPYKLVGQQGELFILVISGSERVFVNGVLLTRGENADYIIDYNAGEVRFNPTFPITSEMRISIEYQYSERNFTRFIGYATGGFQSERLKIDTYAYTESDAKNQPLQQDLNEDQVNILAAAGDDPNQAIAPSAVRADFSENRIQYARQVINGVPRFVFSQDPQAELFNVRFSFVGDNQGNYVLIDSQAISNIYEYREPANGVPQGSFEPVIQLFAPETLTIAGLKAQYQLANTTKINTEVAASNNDLNRFSAIDDNNNTGVAAKLGVEQVLFQQDSTQTLKILANTDFIQSDFRNVERVYNIEFNRDWNLDSTVGDQLFTNAGINYVRDTTITANYTFQHLEFSDRYNGNRHNVAGRLQGDGWLSRFRGSVLSTNSTTQQSTFNRADASVIKRFQKNWAGARLNLEDNEQMDKVTGQLTALSQRFTEYEVYAGRGDSTATFVEIGYRYRVNDSLRAGDLQRVNRSNNYYVRSQPIKDEVQNLLIYANYRVLKSEDPAIDNEVSLNSRVLYNRKLFKNKILWNTTYETNSGTIPQQDFTYLEVNPGQGTFTWIDYNGDGIQDLNEFEVAQFQDQARYVRILLPNQIFIPIHQNKFSQTITLNPISWSGEEGLKKVLSQFYNQTSYLIDRKVVREGERFDLNPFDDRGDQLGLNLSFRNSLFFNRGKQRYTTNYTYLSTTTENLQSIGSIESELESHQITFLHKIADSWLFTFNGQTGFNASCSENFANRNFEIDENLLKPQISYLFGESNRIDVFYEYQKKDNQINDTATLDQQNLGLGWSLNNGQKYAINGELRYVNNDFTGQAFSPVGFQMLEGLQAGQNLTWNLLVQKKVTNFIDLNLSYQGRNSETARTVHTGSVQLKAYF
ncbi:hypothetical protein AAU57_02950 [Nonlabens sp. YIK11]|uniref:hypothetical protein n=1 Tax=Nonlabens sp. YIK11 TaxID=1453349 RepID=UPI0006DCD260|nr:hypothetical protein [Nonlabens sp. YIK11]KQC32402.1 hypothetical protein AAU57_02950 [Nonlabens sp. YIK11]